MEGLDAVRVLYHLKVYNIYEPPRWSRSWGLSMNKDHWIITFGIVAIILAGLYYNQKQSINKLSTDLTNLQHQYTSLQKKEASESSQLKADDDLLLDYALSPSPSPQVIYRTKYVQTPPSPQTTSPTRCRPDYIGGFYCTADNGTQTHCRSDYTGGMICQ